MSQRKVLIADIETSPHLCYSFQTYNTNITMNQVLEPTRMISFSGMWEHEERVHFFSEYKRFHLGGAVDQAECHEFMVWNAFQMLDQADVFVHYNGDRFDIPHLHREFDKYNLGRPSPYVSVDLYKVMKKDSVYAFHKLAWIVDQLHLAEKKMDNSGWQLWKDVLCDDPDRRHKAWLEMRRYNKQDVKTTRELYRHALPLITNLPHLDLFGEEADGETRCPACGSGNFNSRGFRYTKTRKYPRFSCNECKRWFSGTRSVGSVTVS